VRTSDPMGLCLYDAEGTDFRYIIIQLILVLKYSGFHG
jgi:hypothetical protein